MILFAGPHREFFIEEVLGHPDFFVSLRPKLDFFFVKYILPELLAKKAHYRRNACAFDNGRTILIHTVVLFLSAGRIWEHDTV